MHPFSEIKDTCIGTQICLLHCSFMCQIAPLVFNYPVIILYQVRKKLPFLLHFEWKLSGGLRKIEEKLFLKNT